MSEDPARANSVGEHAAVFGRLKDLLSQQIEQFRNYLAALEKQQAAIESGGGENILAYTEIEEGIAANIISIQKAIDPLEAMCRAAIPPGEISALKSALEDLRNRAIAQSERNRNRLSARMADTGAEIAALRNNPLAMAARRSLYHGTASIIDIEG